MLLGLRRATLFGGGDLLDPDALLYKAVVVAAGGMVSDARLALISALIVALKAAGVWTLLDRLWLLAAENSQSALIDLVARASATAVNSPTFTADRQYAFNGTTSSISTNFVPSTDAVAMAANDLGMWIYERTDVGSGFSGGANTSNPPRVGLYMRGRSGTSMAAVANGGGNTTIVTSAGFNSATRSGATQGAWQNGSALGAPTGETQGASLPAHSLSIGALNDGGVVGSFSTRSIAAFAAGKGSLSAGQQTSFYNAVQSHMTSIGAQV